MPIVSGTGVKVPVVAVDPGEKGNVPALAISKIDVAGFSMLTVVNEQPLSGGTDAEARTASAEDRARLKEALFQQAQSRSLSELTVRVEQSESLIPHSMQVRIDDEEYDKAVDEQGDRLKGTVYVVASAIAFANQDLNNLVEGEWRRTTPKDYRPLPESATVAPPEVVDASSRSATLRVKVTGRAEPVVGTDKLTEELRGLTVSDARSKLQKLEGGFSLVGVEIWPQWAPRAFRIEVDTIQ